MARYVDGFVIPVPKKNTAAYKKMAKLAAKVWMDHGALEYIECMGDDVPPGKTTSFAMSVKAKSGEVVWFSWIVYKSRSDRNKILKKVMADPRMKFDPKKSPFDMRRMIYGGFKTVIER